MTEGESKEPIIPAASSSGQEETKKGEFSLAKHNKPGMSSSAKRIQKELAEISLDPPCNVNAGPSGSNLYEWV